MPSDEASLTLSAVLDAVLDQTLDRVRLGMPGRVESYDATTQLCSVQPLIKRKYTDDLGDHVEQLPVLPDVPVIFVGSGPFSITWGLAKGDTVWLEFGAQSLERWLQRGGIVEPMHAAGLHDAVAIPGLRSKAEAVDGAPSRASGTMVIDAPTEVQIGGTEPLVTRAEFLAHGHPVVATGAVSPTAGPVQGLAPPGTELVFPGTAKLRG